MVPWWQSLPSGRRISLEVEPPPAADAGEDELADTLIQIVHTLTYALELRDSARQILGHCARVSALAGQIGRELGLSRAEQDCMRRAAQLHEVGMIAVPAELLLRPGPLAPEELARVHAQARVGAEIVRSTHLEPVARLIEHQYDDFALLQRQRGLEEKELLMAGILRVADVYDALTMPRPYQAPFSPAARAELLDEGLGTRFHPAAVQAALRLSQRGA